MVSIGGQIQGTEYRHFVSASHPDERNGSQPAQVADCLDDVKRDGATGWWWIDEGTESAIQTVVGNGNFRKFGAEAFLYTRGNAEDLNFERLSRLVSASVKRARLLLETDKKFRGAADGMLGL